MCSYIADAHMFMYVARRSGSIAPPDFRTNIWPASCTSQRAPEQGVANTNLERPDEGKESKPSPVPALLVRGGKALPPRPGCYQHSSGSTCSRMRNSGIVRAIATET